MISLFNYTTIGEESHIRKYFHIGIIIPCIQYSRRKLHEIFSLRPTFNPLGGKYNLISKVEYVEYIISYKLNG